MIQEKIEKNDQIFTSILVVQEVGQRLLSELIGNNSITRELKQGFNQYIKFGEKFRKLWLNRIRNNYGEECEELHEVDADKLYELFNVIRDLTTEEQFTQAKYVLKNIVNNKIN